jgi:hypothetical protein
VAILATQAGVDAVGQRRERIRAAAIEKVLQLFEQHLGASSARASSSTGLQPDVGIALRIAADEESEGADAVQPILDQPVAAQGEVRCEDVDRPLDAPSEELIERVGQPVVYFVDDEG